MDNLIGKTIERYELIEKLGEGGMAVVYKARDTRLNCFVAIKLIQMERLTSEMAGTSVKRFEREAKAVALLAHPNIVKVTDFGEYEGIPFLVMEYIPGGTLKSRMGKQIPYAEAASLLLPIARALQYAHSHKIIHRDVKPSNILITETNEPKLIDFGIAKILDLQEGHTLTETGVGLGTPEYMPPEQWLGKISPAVDIYSLGAIFYELITGAKPFTADTSAEVMLKTINDPLPRPTTLVADLPEQVEYYLFKALAKNVEKRFHTMSEMVQMLEKLVKGDLSSAPKSRRKIDLQKEFMTVEKKKTQPMAGSQQKKSGRRLWVAAGILVLGLAAFVLLSKSGSLNQLLHLNAPDETASMPAAILASSTTIPTIAETPTTSPTSTAVNPNGNVDVIPRNGKGKITRIKFSPDGSKIGIATTIGIYVYSSTTFEELFFIETGTTSSSLAFSPDGQTLAANSTDEMIWLWNANDGELIQTLKGHTDQVFDMAYSGDGKTLASTSFDGTVKIWQTSDGALLNSFDTLDKSVLVTNVALSQDGQMVACGTHDGRTWIRYVLNGALLFAFDGGDVSSMAFSADGKLFYAGGSIWRLSNGYPQQESGNSGHALSYDTGTMAVMNYGGAIEITHLDDNTIATFIPPNGSSFTNLALSKNGEILAASDENGVLYFWNVGTTETKLEKSEEDFIQTAVIDIAFSEDGKHLAAVGEKTVNLWKISDGKLINSILVKQDNTSQDYYVEYVDELSLFFTEDTTSNIKLSPNALYYATIQGEKQIIVRKISDNSLVQKYEGDRLYISSILFSNDSNSIIFDSLYWSSESTIWDFKQNTITTNLNSHDNILIFPTSEGDKLISGYKNGIRLWQLPAGTLLYSIETGGVPNTVSSDGETMATGTYDGTVELRKVVDGVVFSTINCYTDRVTSADFSSDGSLLAVGTNDGTVEIIQVSDGSILETYQGQTGMITKVLFSPNDKLVASSSSDGSIRFWNLNK